MLEKESLINNQHNQLKSEDSNLEKDYFDLLKFLGDLDIITKVEIQEFRDTKVKQILKLSFDNLDEEEKRMYVAFSRLSAEQLDDLKVKIKENPKMVGIHEVVASIMKYQLLISG